MLTDDQKKQMRVAFDEDIPRDVVKTRQGSGNKKFSYLEGHYVIDRLNKILGQGEWSYTTEEVNKVFEGTLKDAYGKETYNVSYIAKVKLTFNGFVTFSDYGYGDGMDSKNPGKAHELAIKEAVTDGLKRCAKNLGMSVGLALYDKNQTHVSDAPAAAPPQEVVASPPKEAVANGDEVRKAIKSAAQVLNAKKILSIAAFREQYLAPVGASKVDELADDIAKSVYSRLKSERTELQLN